MAHPSGQVDYGHGWDCRPERTGDPSTRSEKAKGTSAHDHSHPEGEWNGHAWVSPKQAALMVTTIAEGLARVDPGRAEIYRANGKDYQRKLENLFEEMKAVAGRSPNKRVLPVHRQFRLSGPGPGLAGGGERSKSAPVWIPPPSDMARLIRMIKEGRGGGHYHRTPVSR